MARRKFKRAPETLPQYDETWHVLSHQIRIWITPEFEDPYRPYVVMIFNLEQDIMQSMELVPHQPSPGEMLQLSIKAMQKPPLSTGQKAHRPLRIHFENDHLVDELKPELVKFDIDVQRYPRLEHLNAAIADMENHMAQDGPKIPALLSIKGATPEILESFFATAANFYRAAPWVYLTDEHPLSIQVSPEQSPRFLHVMGSGGVEYGVAMYRRWADVERVYSFTDNPLERLPPDGGNSCFFDPPYEFPFDDLEAQERYGWEVAGENAYPVPLVFLPTREVKRPDLEDLHWYEAALQAIPVFVEKHFPSYSIEKHSAENPLEGVLTIPTYRGMVEVCIKLPGGHVPMLGRPVDMNDWPDDDDEFDDDLLAFDRRAMESSMQLFGPTFDDPQLSEAQNLMYEAFDETNPGKRIIMAHEALDISPNCADAYVLLAEEEADTLGRALTYYQQGVEAGERALGEDFFKENEGHFWGLLETRPYMRARQGLANALWKLGRNDEALKHFEEMLRLNPGDNQGIRYSLLNVLVTSNRNVEALELVKDKEYADDAMAEWAYTHALLMFRIDGVGKKADILLQEAQEINAHVPDYLTGRKRLPNQLPPYISWGGEDEAVGYAAGYLAAWRQTPGAIDWLKSKQTSSKGKVSKTKRKK